MSLEEDLRAYKPVNAQEAADKELMLERLACDPRAFERDALAHFACSAWTVDPTGTQTLLCYHNIYDSWSWIGGHADGEKDLLAVARRELEEETGVTDARPVTVGGGPIASIEVLAVAGHMRRGVWVSSHAHLNVTYLFVADPAQPLRVKPDENSAVRWAALEDIFTLSSEPWLCKHIYEKLVARTRDLLG